VGGRLRAYHDDSRVSARRVEPNPAVPTSRGRFDCEVGLPGTWRPVQHNPPIAIELLLDFIQDNSMDVH
jgi:hypothetical protein